MIPAQRLAAIALALFALPALHCATQPYATGSSADAEYDFASVKSLAFARVPQKVVGSPHGKILRAAIEESLTARGFSFVEEGEADLWISYDVGVFHATAVTWAQHQGPGRGRIIVRAIDPKGDEEVWYGWAEARLRSTPDPENRIRAAVETLFETRVRSRVVEAE